MPQKAKYELTFWGSATAKYFPRRYRRYHTDAKSVADTISRVFAKLRDGGYPTACHTPVVCDGFVSVKLPECGQW